MAEEEILIVQKEKDDDKLRFKIRNKRHNNWGDQKYLNVISSKDPNALANIFYDLHLMGYPIAKAFHKFKEITEEPSLWFNK